MALIELLDQNITNFAGLNPVELKPENNPLKKYRKLQNSEIYDKEIHQWVETSGWRFTLNQLLGVIVEAALFGPEEARKLYEILKQSKLYDAEHDIWINSMRENPDKSDLTQYTYNKLNKLLIEGKFYNKENAVLQYEQMTNEGSPIYDRKNKLWIREEGSSKRLLYDQFLGIHFLSEFYGLDQAIKQFEHIKEKFYDKETGQWINSINQKIQVKDPYRLTINQLYGVFIESLFDKQYARGQFASMKKSFFDEQNQHWIYNLSPDQSAMHDSISDIPNRLLEILIEKNLERKNILIQSKPIPEIRRF